MGNLERKTRKLSKLEIAGRILPSVGLLATAACTAGLNSGVIDFVPPASVTPFTPAPEKPFDPTAIFTATETLTREFSVDSMTFSNNKAENDKIIAELNNQKLESSIKLEADGYHTSFTRWENEQPVTEDILIDPSTLGIDINNKNVYGKTPTIETKDGQTLLWSQEHNDWFAPVEIPSEDNIMEPVYVPFGYQDVLLRSLLLNPEISAPFGPNTRFEGLIMVFKYTPETGEKYAYLRTKAEYDQDITADKLGVEWTNAWFYTNLADGTRYQYTPTKWLDPQDPNNPQMDEFKIIFCARGQETIGYNTQVDLRNGAINEELIGNLPNTMPRPILAASEGFFTNGQNVFNILRIIKGTNYSEPSLAKLFGQTDNNPRTLNVFNSNIDFQMGELDSNNIIIDVPMDPDQLDPQVQTMIFPCAFGRWTGSPQEIPGTG